MEVLELKRAIKEIVGTNKKPLQELQQALEIAEGIAATIREHLLVIDASLRILWANKSIYKLFSVKPTDSKGRLNGQFLVHGRLLGTIISPVMVL